MKLSNLASVLRNAGLTVVETAGWSNRGYAGQDLQAVAGVLWHHTATNRSRFNEDAPTLSMCVNGRSDLAGPLCNIVFGRNGTVYLVAAGVANHAGAGSAAGIPVNMGNHYLIGIEMESSGIAPWDWTADQLRVAPHLGAALERAYGVSLQIAHYEYSSQGKIDPAGWPGGMDGLRDSINKILTGTIQPQSITIEEDFMATMNDDEKRRLLAAADRINGRDVQRWIGPENQVSDTWVEGWFPARSVDLHDVLALHQLAHDNTSKVLDAVRNIPGVDSGVIDRLGVELEARLDQSVKGLRVTLVPEAKGE